MKKILAILLACMLCISFIAACAGSGTSGGGEITLVSNKVEIHGALERFSDVYYEKTGVRVHIQSYGGETPYAPALSALFAGGQEPELFVFEGIAGYEDARNADRVYNLNGQAWVADTDLAYMSPTDGSVAGFPVAIEGWGLGYNVRILQEAGVDPASMTSFAGMKAAFEAVDAKKADLGLEAVISMTAGAGMEWVTGLHGVNAYLSLGLAYNDTSVIDKLNRGEVDRARLDAFAEYYNLVFQHSNPSTLLTGGYDQQLADFSLEKTAFIHQGNWVDPTFEELGVNFEMGYVPHAFLAETTNGIFVGAPSWYLVNARADDANIKLALDFLNYLASSPEGHAYMVQDAGMVPAFKSVTLKPEGPLSKAVQEWSAAGKIYAWHQNEMPAGFGMGTLGPVFFNMANGDFTPAQFADAFADAVATIG